MKSKKEELTCTESIVLELIKEGFSSSEIALNRKCSVRTIEKHRSNIIKKLNLRKEPNTILRNIVLKKIKSPNSHYTTII